MTAMIYMDEELSERLNVVESRKRLVEPVSGSEFTSLSSEAQGKHGKSSFFIVFDELAVWRGSRAVRCDDDLAGHARRSAGVVHFDAGRQ